LICGDAPVRSNDHIVLNIIVFAAHDAQSTARGTVDSVLSEPLANPTNIRQNTPVSHTPLSPLHTLPDWDGVPRDELGHHPISGVDLLATLRESFLRGEGLANKLNQGALESIRGGEVVVDRQDRVAMVRLWVPAFEDQRTGSRDQHAAHVPISAEDRWDTAGFAIGAIAAALPDRTVELGFLDDDGHAYALPMPDYYRHYDPHPPEFAVGYWNLV
jgi:hypothetical protein